jgi:predicted DNA-binding transcriptional regulator YafY
VKRRSLAKTALPRIYRIDAEIASGKFPNSGYLAEVCETSVATISRDIAFMKDQLFAPIEYDAFNRGYCYTKKLYRLPAGFSGAEDLLALGMAKSILSLYRETPLYKAASQLLESITAPIVSDGNRDWLENRILVPRIATAKIQKEIWETIVGGLKENRLIGFDYIGAWDKVPQPRRVRPYQLLFDAGVWYLYGYAEERKGVRIFSLSRMKNIALLKDVFQLPKNFSYNDWAGDSYFGVFIGQEKYRFSIECYASSAVYAAERQWAADQKISSIEDGIVLEFSSTQYNRVLSWVLSCGSDAIPIKPERLVSDWKAEVARMSKLAEEN